MKYPIFGLAKTSDISYVCFVLKNIHKTFNRNLSNATNN